MEAKFELQDGCAIKPRPYDVDDLREYKRLLRELRGYMRVSLNDGTDREGRKYALAALEELCSRSEENTL